MVSFLPAAGLDVDANSFTAVDIQVDEIGKLFWDEAGRAFKFVKFNQDVDVAAGEAVEYADITFTSDSELTDPELADAVVSGQTSGGGNAIDGLTAGVALTAHAASTDSEDKWGWIQVYGPCQDLVDAGNTVSAGDYVVPDSSNDGEWDTVGAGSEHEAGAVALTGASGGTFDAYLLMR